MYTCKKFSEHCLKKFSAIVPVSLHIITVFLFSVKSKREKAAAFAAAREPFLSLAERLAVGALVHGRICLVGAHGDAIQGAVIGIVAVVSALLDSAFDTFVGMTAHT
jgi:succinate dehydrogenase hydrophobic anchor subunit